MSLARTLEELGGKACNRVDVLIECALFSPDSLYKAIRPNAAGTKCIYTLRNGAEETHRARDWTEMSDIPSIIAALRKIETVLEVTPHV